MHFVLMHVILLYSDHQHILATQLAIFRVVKYTNTNIFIVRQNHSSVRIIQFWVIFWLNEYKILEFKNGCLEYGPMEQRTLKVCVVNYDPHW
jgi:hypothetical protein